MKLQRPKGTADILPAESNSWHYIENLARGTFEKYHFKEIRTPIFEHYEVVSRSVGDTTDIVQKEMYDFYDKGERHITLRPEGTAPVVRAYVENKLYAPEVPKPVKLYYMGPMFRYERPQSGRLRQFHQIGAETFGIKSPALDAELIAMVDRLFRTLGLTGYSIRINSLGTSESRAAYRQSLIDYFAPHRTELSADSQRRLDSNPLRVLDSKEEVDKHFTQDAPSILDSLSADSAAYFTQLKEALAALSIPYVVDDRIVRGLDYYSDTIFEFVAVINGQELTLCGGGRYDGLVEYFDGPEMPGIGFAIGVERLLLALKLQGITLPVKGSLDVYIATLGDSKPVTEVASVLAEALRGQGYSVERNFANRKLGAQFKAATDLAAQIVIPLGEEEVESGRVTVKNNVSRKEVTTTLDTISKSFAAVREEVLRE